MEAEDSRSVEERLKEKGVLIDYSKGEWGNHMLTDLLGNELGCYKPLAALREFCGYKGKIESDYS